MKGNVYEDIVTLYTDGACSGNSGKGGWAALLICEGQSREIRGFKSITTNNQMELTAAIRGLQLLKRPCEVQLFSDSAYLCNAFNEGWLAKWQHNGWFTQNNHPVANKDLWMELLNLSRIHNITWYKVKGHSDNQFNNRCDKLARLSIKDQKTII